jgi:hypothetical protein
MYRPVLLAGLALLMSTTAAFANNGPIFHKKTLRMSPEAIVAGTIVEDDSLETEAVLSTQYAPNKGKKPLRQTSDRAYLKAVIDKSSGAVRYEVKQIIYYPGDQRDYFSAQYLTPAGLRQAKLADVRHGVLDCFTNDYDVISCMRTKYVSFSIAETDLKAIASAYQPGGPGNFIYKFKERSGVDYSGGLVAAEVVGMLKAVANYQQSRSLASAAPSS